jgi:hypothetical protein
MAVPSVWIELPRTTRVRVKGKTPSEREVVDACSPAERTLDHRWKSL